MRKSGDMTEDGNDTARRVADMIMHAVNASAISIGELAFAFEMVCSAARARDVAPEEYDEEALLLAADIVDDEIRHK